MSIDDDPRMTELRLMDARIVELDFQLDVLRGQRIDLQARKSDMMEKRFALLAELKKEHEPRPTVQ